MLDLVLRNVRLPEGRVVDLSVADGYVHHLGSAGQARESIDCRDLICLPAGVDMHVHMRGGVQSYKEDWESGSRSALSGGIGLVVDQPNTEPPLTTPDRFSDRVREAASRSWCHFAVNGGVTGAESDIEGLWKAGAMSFGEIFTAPSTGSDALDIDTLAPLLSRIRSLGALATLHAERAAAHPPHDLLEHHRLRPVEGESDTVRRIGESFPHPDSLHFCHLSARSSLLRARGTREVTPHHLLLSLERFAPEDTRGKVNPPLRPEPVRRELQASWDHIDVIASDHAPHTGEEKRAPFPAAPSGVPGVETLLPLLVSLVLDHRVSLPSLIEKTSAAPSRILGLDPPGFAPGCRADFALFPREQTRISPELLHTRCDWTPFEGMKGVFLRMVLLDGRLVYREGEFLERKGRWFPGRGYIPSATTI